MRDLIGKECQIAWRKELQDLQRLRDWYDNGTVTVVDVEMPMVHLRSDYTYQSPAWVNVALIAQLTPVETKE